MKQASAPGLSVLHISSSPFERERLRRAFEKAGWRLRQASTFGEALQALTKGPSFTMVICDRYVTPVPWTKVLQRVARGSVPPAFLISVPAGAERAWAPELQGCAAGLISIPFKTRDVLRRIPAAHRAWLMRVGAGPGASRSQTLEPRLHTPDWAGSSVTPVAREDHPNLGSDRQGLDVK
jgi:hypothetical protein